MINAQHCQRQYDRSHELAQAVNILTLMPDEIRSIISESVLNLMHQEYEETMQEKHYRSLGSDKILGLHKAEHRRRAYDQNPILHRAMSHFYILSETAQDYMGKHILAMLNYIQSYLDTCGELQQDPSLEDVAAITQRYIEKGSAETEAFLKELWNKFYIKVFGHSETSNPSRKLDEDIGSTQEGMKISKLDLD